MYHEESEAGGKNHSPLSPVPGCIKQGSGVEKKTGPSFCGGGVSEGFRWAACWG